MPTKKYRCHSEDLMDADISFPLARLFDRFNLDHIPNSKRMDEFEHRDLAHIKHYKAAVKIFGGPLSRKRVIIAPPMETPLKHRLGINFDKASHLSPLVLNSELSPQKLVEKPPAKELIMARQAMEREDTYRAWFMERQKFRDDLENMGLNLEWLTKKTNKTVLEKRVLRQLQEKKNEKNILPSETETMTKSTRVMTADSDMSSLPQINVPSPLSLAKLEQHLKDKKLRLLDLFTAADKNKDWKISREEFTKTCQKNNIPISQGSLEDLLVTLDMDLDDELDYREMARGMELARREKWDEKRKELSEELLKGSQPSGTEGVVQTTKSDHNDTNDVLSPNNKINLVPDHIDKSNRPINIDEKINNFNEGSSNRPKSQKSSSMSKRRTGSTSPSKSAGAKPAQQVVSPGSKVIKTAKQEDGSQFLKPPEPDVRLEQMIFNNEEMLDLRKHDRDGLKWHHGKLDEIPPNIMTGSVAIDNHCMPSTLMGEVGEMVDKFRQKTLREYYAVKDLCQENGVILSTKLLERVLLYPPEKLHRDLKKIRHPDSAPLMSSNFFAPPNRSHTTAEVKHKDKVLRTRSGKLMMNTRHNYPTKKRVHAEGFKQNLSTGRAVIHRKVNCWMTFEEYEKLTKHLAVCYRNIHGSTNENAFWPGHLLQKLRLCMPPYDKNVAQDQESAIFRRVHRTPAVNYGYESAGVWPTNSSMYTQLGIHDHFRNKTII